MDKNQTEIVSSVISTTTTTKMAWNECKDSKETYEDSFADSSGHSIGDGSGGTNSKTEKVNIRQIDSMVDTKKRLRIIKAQGPIIRVCDGYQNSLCVDWFGTNVGNFCFHLLEGNGSFACLAACAIIGLVFTVIDVTTESVHVITSFACAAMLPWAIVVLSVLNRRLLGALLSMFNTWFLLIQVLAMLTCIGLIAKRSFMVLMICPSLIATIFVDAVPPTLRKRVTVVSYVLTCSFILTVRLSVVRSVIS